MALSSAPMRQVFVVNHRGVLMDGHSTDSHLVVATKAMGVGPGPKKSGDKMRKKWLSLKALKKIWLIYG